MISRYAFLQRECHKLINEVFSNKAEGYKWLKDNYGVSHFREFDKNFNVEKLEQIHEKLVIKSIIY